MLHRGIYASRMMLISMVMAMASASASQAGPILPENITATPISFNELEGWHEDDHLAAFKAFEQSCKIIQTGQDVLRAAVSGPSQLQAICHRRTISEVRTKFAAKRFFETNFTLFRLEVANQQGLLTGYFEPEVQGSRQKTSLYTVPLLARPSDLVTRSSDHPLQNIPQEYSAGQRLKDGFAIYPDRAAIEAGALGQEARPVVYLRDAVDAFMIHIQGSARVRLTDDRVLRVAYAGRNGHPYTSIGRLAVSQGHLKLEDATADRLYAWLRKNPEIGRLLMQANKSYIFFREAEELDPQRGPLGGGSVQLTKGRSIAIDRGIWSYGLPFWLSANLGDVDGSGRSTNRLVVAQDTGSAIIGAVRADLFVGSGEAAGVLAGRLRHPLQLVVLWPKP